MKKNQWNLRPGQYFTHADSNITDGYATLMSPNKGETVAMATTTWLALKGVLCSRLGSNNNNNKCFICMTINELQYCKSY